MSFSGFSEEDIKKLTTPQNASKSEKAAKMAKKAAIKHTPKPSITKPKDTKTMKEKAIPENARLSPEEPKETLAPPETNGEEVIKAEVTTEPKKFKNLDEFDAKQKLIEEQNRKRKELLSKALADRTKQTQEEAQRLQEIQDEFKKLDALLSNDVKLLRKQIEVASVEYSDCQKRYHKIEKEFLDAKVLLHQKLEKKELLTEHLCTIIEKNEERKAEKLTELLIKLNNVDSVIDNKSPS